MHVLYKLLIHGVKCAETSNYPSHYLKFVFNSPFALQKQKAIKPKLFNTPVLYALNCSGAAIVYTNDSIYPKLNEVGNAAVKSTFDMFFKKPLQFMKAYKIAELSTYSLLIFFDL